MNDTVSRPNGQPQEDLARSSRGPATGGAGGIATPAEETAAGKEALERELGSLRAQCDDWKDQYLRSAAEFANYRKRQERDRQQQTLSITIEVLRKLLPAVDDLERAMQSVPGDAAGAAWAGGISLIERKLQGLLREFGVAPIEALGKVFDPNLHYSLMHGVSTEYSAGTVMEELQRGYVISGQVIRPTMVKVSLGPVADVPASGSTHNDSTKGTD